MAEMPESGPFKLVVRDDLLRAFSKVEDGVRLLAAENACLRGLALRILDEWSGGVWSPLGAEYMRWKKEIEDAGH